MHEDIRVSVTKYSDRPYWTAYYRDPITEKLLTKSTKAKNQSDAMRFATKWEAELRAGQSLTNSRITFAEFRKRYEREKLPSLTKSSQESYIGALDSLEMHLAPKRLASLTAAALSDYQAKLRARGNRETAIAARLRHVKAILNWAVSMGLMAKAPRIVMPKRGKGSKAMRGRPISGEEFDRMLAAVPKLRKHDGEQWRHFLRGLWLTGLRLGESLNLSWDASEAFAVDLSGKYPRFRIYGEAQKSGRDELLPMTPDAAEFFAATPEADRTGPVFSLGQTEKRICRIVSAIGRAAGVVVDKASGKFASAHDLRRSFSARGGLGGSCRRPCNG